MGTIVNTTMKIEMKLVVSKEPINFGYMIIREITYPNAQLQWATLQKRYSFKNATATLFILVCVVTSVGNMGLNVT